jgi:hypothetical protein
MVEKEVLRKRRERRRLPGSLVEQCLAADDWMRTVVGTSSTMPYNYDVIHLNIEGGNIITIIYIVDRNI